MMNATLVRLADETLGDLVLEHSARARVLERWGIDYCCHGQRTLAEACQAAGCDVDEVARALNQAEASAELPAETRWSEHSLGELIDHILQEHHAYLRAELPRISSLFEKVVETHGRHHPQLAELYWVFVGLRDHLVCHMLKEEHVLFPGVRRLEAASRVRRSPQALALQRPTVGRPGPALDEPIAVMRAEHEEAGEALAAMRRLTNNYYLPAGACASWRALWAALCRLEADLHLHVHEENNLLFPRALLLAGQLGMVVSSRPCP